MSQDHLQFKLCLKCKYFDLKTLTSSNSIHPTNTYRDCLKMYLVADTKHDINLFKPHN